MERTYADYVGDYYDRLESVIDMNGSGFKSYVDADELKKIIFYTNQVS